MNIGKSEAVTKNKNLKWVAMTSAGVDFLFKPGMFAAEDVRVEFYSHRRKRGMVR